MFRSKKLKKIDKNCPICEYVLSNKIETAKRSCDNVPSMVEETSCCLVA